MVGSEIPVMSAGVSIRGGAHGAFTWGVLDCVLEGDCIGFDGISAKNAGGMNATVFAFRIAADSKGARSDVAPRVPDRRSL